MIFDLQKASLSKRLSAYMFDVIIFAVVVSGIALLLAAVMGVSSKVDRLEEYKDYYLEKYDIDDSDISWLDPSSMSEEQLAKYEAADKEFREDKDATALFMLVINMVIIIVSISPLISFVILEFTIPLILKNGQTLGKKIFGIALMRDDHVKVTPVMMFVRSIIGKYTVETMVPIFLIVMMLTSSPIIPLFILLLLAVLQIFLFVRTKTNSFIHDIFAYTVAVDMQSQMIFETKEAMIEYKNMLHAEEAKNQSY